MMENEFVSIPMDDKARKSTENSGNVCATVRKSIVVESRPKHGITTSPYKDNDNTLSRSIEVPIHTSETRYSEDKKNRYIWDDDVKSVSEQDRISVDLEKNSEATDSSELGNGLTNEREEKPWPKCTCSTGAKTEVSKIEEMHQLVESAMSSSEQRARLGEANRKPRMVVKPNQDRLPCHPHERSRSVQDGDVWQTKDRVSETMGQLLASARCSLQAEVSATGSVSSTDAHNVCYHETSGTPAAVRRQVAKVQHLPLTSAATAPVTCAGLQLLRGGSDRRSAHAPSRMNNSDIYATIRAPRLKMGGAGLASADEIFLRSGACCQATADRSTMNTIHVYYAPRSTAEDVFVRIMLSTAFALVVAAITLLWTHLYLCYALTTCVVLSGLLFLVLPLALILSRACRCVSSLILPSISTPRGRLSLIIVTLALLLTGPCDNIYSNVEEAARAIRCSVERGYNQTLTLLEPFDAMMGHVNRTIAGLQDSAHGVITGLRPLDEGLADIESDLDNGRRQLFGTEKVSSTHLRNCNRNLQTSKAPPETQAQCIGLFTSAD